MEMMNCFPLAAFRIFSLSLAFEFVMCLSEELPLSLSYLGFVGLLGHVVSHLSSNLGSFWP